MRTIKIQLTSEGCCEEQFIESSGSQGVGGKGDNSGCHNRGGASGIQWVEPRDAAQHPTMHRVAPTTKKYAEYLEQRLAQRKPFASVSYNIISKAYGKAWLVFPPQLGKQLMAQELLLLLPLMNLTTMQIGKCT